LDNVRGAGSPLLEGLVATHYKGLHKCLEDKRPTLGVAGYEEKDRSEGVIICYEVVFFVNPRSEGLKII